jgi:hypothetical protein
MTYQIVNNLHVLPNRMDMRVIVSTSLGENIDVDDVYQGFVDFI